MTPEKLRVVQQSLIKFMEAEPDADVRRAVIQKIKEWKPSTFEKRRRPGR